MRIGILTQALHGNYGGILQNYALQETLRKLGHNPITIDRHKNIPSGAVKDLGKFIVRHLYPQFESGFLTDRERRMLISNISAFVDRHISRTRPIYTQAAFDAEVNNDCYDAFIVGSDQCWRPIYSANILNYYLDFVTDLHIKKIVYAASFGVDNWEYSDAQTEQARNAAKRLDAISVREHSGVELCRKYLNVDAHWVLDPTMLLGAEGYTQFVSRENAMPFITTYMLEYSPRANRVLNKIRKAAGLDNVKHNLPSPIFKRFSSIKGHMNISVEEWLSNISNASFVVTDSFHGAVFSILFNTPFAVMLNTTRGNTRLESLLSDFGLEDCIINDSDNFSLPVFDWEAVNRHLTERRQESAAFLENSLCL